MKMSEILEKKIVDFQRFIITLLMLTGYLYIGTLISIYEYEMELHLYLYPFIISGLLTAFVMVLKVKRWQRVQED